MSLDSVVRVFATVQEPDYDSPWQPRGPKESSGSGVVVSPTQILTGAHVVANATFLQVQKVSNPDKCTARVVAVCHDIDLALLEVVDPDFLADLPPQEIGDLPSLRDPVSVVGYPVGGDEISVTEGVVSRIELQRYRQSRRFFLAITVDAAINSGNSGGPAFKDGKVIGIAFQTLKDAENIGELVPGTLIRSFLKHAQNQPKMVLPALGARVQHLENPHLRERLGLPKSASGALVTGVAQGSSSWGVLQNDDVLLELDGHSVANNGTVQYRDRLRTGLGVLLGDHQVGDSIQAKVWRAGAEVELRLTLAPVCSLVPEWQYDSLPSYIIHGGVVFQELSLDFIATWSRWWENAPAEFLDLLYSGLRTDERQAVVIVTNVLADEVNVGYRNFVNESVTTVEGVIPRDLQHFAELLRTSVADAAKSTEIRTAGGGRLVFNKEATRDGNRRILERYKVPQARSADLAGPDAAKP